MFKDLLVFNPDPLDNEFTSRALFSCLFERVAQPPASEFLPNQ